MPQASVGWQARERRREASSRSPGNGHISRVGRRDGSVRATAGGRSPAPFAGRLRPCTWRGSAGGARDSDVGVPRCATPSAIEHRYVTGRWPAAPGLRVAGGSVSRDRSRTALDASRSARSSSQIASSLAASADSRRGVGQVGRARLGTPPAGRAACAPPACRRARRSGGLRHWRSRPCEVRASGAGGRGAQRHRLLRAPLRNGR